MIKPQIVNKLKSINELQLLIYLSNTDTWTHNRFARECAAEFLGIAEITLKKNLKSLLQKTFIKKISKGVYKVNKKILH